MTRLTRRNKTAGKKGLSVHEFVYHADMLKKTLVKRDPEFREVHWDEAVDLTCTRLKQIEENSAANSIGVLGSGKCSNEDNFLWHPKTSVFHAIPFS